MISAHRQGFFAEELYFVRESRPVSLNVCDLLFISITPRHLYVHLKRNHQVIHSHTVFVSFL